MDPASVSATDPSAGLLPLLLLLGVGATVLVYIIAADKKRYLARYDLAGWRETSYLRSLPNFLQAVHDARFPLPWPGRLNAVAASLFRFRMRPILKARPALARRRFLQHHLAFQGLIEIHRPFIDDALLAEHLRIAAMALREMEDTADRDRLLAFCEQAKAQRAAFAESLCGYDRQLLAALRRRGFFATLRIAHAIFQEHGFSLMAELSALRRFETLAPAEMVQELPAVGKLPGRRRGRRKLETGGNW
ncbi:MAG TPA: hypothetical protein VH253_07655 [Phycisphaerae bacterium]|nr:hypothetical protein [Phycisphaerae bacterium]